MAHSQEEKPAALGDAWRRRAAQPITICGNATYRSSKIGAVKRSGRNQGVMCAGSLVRKAGLLRRKSALPCLTSRGAAVSNPWRSSVGNAAEFLHKIKNQAAASALQVGQLSGKQQTR
jgi:hypothetical protein